MLVRSWKYSLYLVVVRTDVDLVQQLGRRVFSSELEGLQRTELELELVLSPLGSIGSFELLLPH